MNIQKNIRERRELLKNKDFYSLSNKERELAESSLRMNDKEEKDFFTEEEITKLNAAAEKKTKNGKYVLTQSPFIIFMLNTGIRAGEAVALQYKHINFENQTAQITRNFTRSKDRDIDGNFLGTSSVNEGDPKTRKSKQSIVLGKKAIQILRELQKDEPEGYTGYIAHDKNQNPISPKALQKRYYAFLRFADVEKRGLHALRHTYASQLYKLTQGETALVSSQLRHSSPSFTADTYVHEEEKYRKRTLQDFEI